jgi:hypothetical protein
MEKTNYDEASRYLARRGGASVLRWLLRLDADHLGFDGFLDSVLTLPGSKQRVCDAVARLRDLHRGGVPVAGLVEFQTQPDPDMLGRLLLAGGICWLTVRPTDLPGDRYDLCAVVVNLTGVGACGRAMTLGTSRWSLVPVEVNLSALDAATALGEVESGAAPGEVLAWIPLMQRGDDPGIIQRWREIVAKEADPKRRGDYGLAVLFANAVGRGELWEKALEGLTMPDVPIVAEWKARARLEAKAEYVLFVLQQRFTAVPEDLARAIQASPTIDKLDRWMAAAVHAGSLEQFRQDAGL